MTTPIGIPRVLGLAALSVLFVICWSSGFLVAAVDVGAPISTLLLWRFAVVVVVLAAVISARERGPLRSPRRSRGFGLHVLIGLLSQVGYVVPVYVAIGLGVSTGTTALIDAVQPLAVAALAGPLLGLRVRGAQWAGLGVGSVGVVFVVSADLGGGTAPGGAYLLPLVAMASLVAATFVERRNPTQIPVVETLLLHSVVALVVTGAFALASGDALPPITGTFWMAVVFVAFSPTLAAYGLYWFLVRRLGVTVLNALLFCVAPTTAVAGAVFFGEVLTDVTTAGLVLCGAGVAIVLTSESRRRVQRTSTPAPAPNS